MASGLGDLPGLSVRRPILACVANLLIVIAGLAALFGIDVRELPDVDRPVLTVTASYPGAAPETVDAEVTRVLEGAVARVSGVDDIRSSSEENSTRIRVRFRPGTDLDAASSDVREAVSRVERQLPDRVEDVNVVKADNDADPVLQVALVADVFDEAVLTERIENDIAPAFQAIDGVAAVTLFGTRQRQLRVVIDPLRLSRFGLTVADVADALEQAPYDVPVGSFNALDQSLLVRAEAVAGTPELIKEVVISGETSVGDVADAFFGPADATSFVRLNGNPIIGFGVLRQAQSNTIEIAQAAREVVDQMNARFDDVELVITSDDAVFIERSVREVLITLAFTTLIVVATIWLFFGSLRATLIPSLAIPTALIGSLAGIWLLGFSINILTLLALVLATGLIVDDAIVVLENMQRTQKQGVKRQAAAVLGTRQVFFAVVATTAVLVSVFVPISFLPSTAGRLFREFGITLALAVTISSFVALTLVPALGARLSMAGEPKGVEKRLNAFGGGIVRRYEKSLKAALAMPWITVMIALAAVVGAVLAVMTVDRELVPEEDRGEVSIFASGPDGVDLRYMDREAAEIEAVLQPYIDSGLIRSLYTVVGRYDPNRIGMTATLAPWDERDMSQQELIGALRGPLDDIPGSRVSVFGRGSLDVGGGRRSGLEVALTGQDYEDIYAAGRALVELIETESEILANAELSYQPTQPQISIRIDRRRANDLGVSLEDLSQTLRVMVGGDDLVDLSVRDQAITIFLTAENSAIRDPSDLRNLYVRSDAGDLVAISSLTTFVEEGVAAELDRTEQRRAIELEADIAPGVPLADAVAEIERLADQSLPDRIEMILQGEAETLGETSRDLLYTYLFAFVIVFLVLAAQFESLTSPVVVILTVPFGLAAAIYALFLTGISLNIFSQIGLVMLIGLMAKNGILMVEFADQRRAEGDSVRDAIAEAAKVRLRPIMMTLISTVLGAVPLILSAGAGAEARQAIGWTVFAGLGLSGLFTLYLTPVVYLGIARLGRPREAGLKDLQTELDRVEGEGAAS
ncbi:efflux RND transporter permease subunit [Maricaulaceae bacterium MS644]